jgi:hypothetical protein
VKRWLPCPPRAPLVPSAPSINHPTRWHQWEDARAECQDPATKAMANVPRVATIMADYRVVATRRAMLVALVSPAERPVFGACRGRRSGCFYG